MRELRLHILRHAARIARFRAFVRKGLQRFLFASKTLAQFAGVIVSEILEPKVEAFDEARAFVHGLRRLGEEPAHFAGAFEMALGIGGEQKTRVLQRDAFPDAGERVGERAAFRDVIMHIVHRDERQAEFARLRDASPHFFAHIGVKQRGRGEPQPALERRAQRGGGRGLAQRDKLLALAELEKIVQNQRAIALSRAHIAARQHQAQPAIGGAVPRIAQDFRGLVGKDQPRADRQPEVLVANLMRAQKGEGAHDAGHGIAVGETYAAMPQLQRLRDQLLGVRSAAQEREIGRRGEFGVAGQGDDHGRLRLL